MAFRELVKDVFCVGVLDTKTPYFDRIMPLPQGTSYNAYVVRGKQKTALIDTVEPLFTQELLDNLAEAGIEHIDYIVANHAEQDHAGAIPAVLARFPEAVVVCDEKCRHLLERELGLSADRFLLVADHQELPLGGKTLRFVFAPWVHWPETMFTFLVEDRVLFTCDLFGAHLADGGDCKDFASVEGPAKRYYAEIMMPFVVMVRKALETVRLLGPAIIAPSHGPVHRDPAGILERYDSWTTQNVQARVVITTVSMHHSTERLAGLLAESLVRRGIAVETFDIMGSDIGDITIGLMGAGCWVLASPVYLGGLHPVAANLCFMENGFKPKVGRLSLIGSSGWQGAPQAQFRQLTEKLGAEYLEPLFVEGLPSSSDLASVESLAATIESHLRELERKDK